MPPISPACQKRSMRHTSAYPTKDREGEQNRCQLPSALRAGIPVPLWPTYERTAKSAKLQHAEQSANARAQAADRVLAPKMTEFLYFLLSTFFACLAVLFSVAFFRVLRAGPGKVSYLRRKRYGLAAWATGGLPKTSGGTTLHELEGLELKASGGRLSHVRRTRATTSEV